MKKVVSFRIKNNDNVILANPIWSNLKNGWEKDLEMQNNSGLNTDKEPSYFFTKKDIAGQVYSLCINAYENKVTTTVIRNREKDRIALTVDEWNSTLDTFVEDNKLERMKGFEWIKLDYIS